MAGEGVTASRKQLARHRVASGAVERLLGRPRRRRQPSADGSEVVVLLFNAYGIGGATRSVFNVAGELAWSRDVEIVSVVRKRQDLRFPFPEGATLSVLDDRRGRGKTSRRSLLARGLSRFSSLLMHPDDDHYSWFSLWTDWLLLRRVRAVRSGLLLTSRPAISAFVARVARPGVIVVAHEHTHFGALAGDMGQEVSRCYHGLDAVVLLTDRDRQDYEALLAGERTRVVAIANAVPRVPGEPLAVADRRRVVVAAGRLTRQKGFDLLIEAFAVVAESHPEWTLEIYGQGPEMQALAAQVDRDGLAGKVTLAGPTEELGQVMSSSAVFALSSRYEGMPMVLLEAMSKRMAVVAFDCPTGPGELVTDDENGLLVPPEDVFAFAASLGRVLADEALRDRLGESAAAVAGAYDVTETGKQWARLLDELTAASSGTSR